MEIRILMKSHLHVIKFAPTVYDIIIVLGHDEEPRDEFGLSFSDELYMFGFICGIGLSFNLNAE